MARNRYCVPCELAGHKVSTRLYLRIPVNVTADSGNVTGIPANVTEGRCCAF